MVQDTWVRALGAYGGTRAMAAGPLAAEAPAVGPSVAWLYRVALNLCYDRLRARKRPRIVLAQPEDMEAVVEPAGRAACPADPEGALLEAEVAAAVRGAIAVLPPALRDVVILREYGDLKYREIAEAVGCPVGTVMSRLHLARQRLRQALAPYLELDFPQVKSPSVSDRTPASDQRPARAKGPVREERDGCGEGE